MAFETLKSIKPAFWLANAQEACERLAYFGIRAVLPLMMVSVGTGGLGLDMADKGIIYGVWALIQCLVPMVSGGFSESFGYKKSLIVAFIINTLGYLLMANILNVAALFTGTTELNTTINFWLMMLGGCTIGLGTALFKPPVQGIVAKSLDKKNSGFGFGLFYWVVNVGGFLAPMIATALRGGTDHPTWHYVFYGAAFVTLFNLLITIIFFKEPARTKEEIDAHKNESIAHVFVTTLKILWADKNMLLFLLIVSGFWLMFMQLWDLLPNFIDEWVDGRAVGGALLSAADALNPLSFQFSLFGDLYEFNPGDLLRSWTDKGAIKPEMIINIDSAAIILFVLPLSALFARYKMMTALILGMVISVFGFVFSGMTMAGGFCCLGVFIFAIGEIICSPKFSEYIGMTAPKDKKAIYMGFSNIPFAVGWAFGNFLSGPLYQIFSSKEVLAQKYLVNHGANAEAIANLKLDKLMEQVQAVSGTTDTFAATDVLWNESSPWVIWIVLGAIGVASMLGIIVFYYKSGMNKVDDARDHESDKDSEDSDNSDSTEDSEGAEQSESADQSNDPNLEYTEEEKALKKDLTKADVEDITIKD